MVNIGRTVGNAVPNFPGSLPGRQTRTDSTTRLPLPSGGTAWAVAVDLPRIPAKDAVAPPPFYRRIRWWA